MSSESGNTGREKVEDAVRALNPVLEKAERRVEEVSNGDLIPKHNNRIDDEEAEIRYIEDALSGESGAAKTVAAAETIFLEYLEDNDSYNEEVLEQFKDTVTIANYVFAAIDSRYGMNLGKKRRRFRDHYENVNGIDNLDYERLVEGSEIRSYKEFSEAFNYEESLESQSTQKRQSKEDMDTVEDENGVEWHL